MKNNEDRRWRIFTKGGLLLSSPAPVYITLPYIKYEVAIANKDKSFAPLAELHTMFHHRTISIESVRAFPKQSGDEMFVHVFEHFDSGEKSDLGVFVFSLEGNELNHILSQDVETVTNYIFLKCAEVIRGNEKIKTP